MKFGFDLHGVIDTKPEFFRSLFLLLFEGGCEVHVLSGPPSEQVEKELEDLGFLKGIHYNYLFSIVDYLRLKGAEMRQDSRGNWWADPYEWDRAKGAYCDHHKIDIHFDDSDTYRYFFKTPFARFFSRDTSRINKTKVDYGKGQKGIS